MKSVHTAATAAILLLAGCAGQGEVDATGGISAVRSACPVVGLPAETGDVTLFDPPAARAASAIDVVASITNLRSTCNDAGADIATAVTFDVRASRTRAEAARDLTLPFYVAILRGGSSVVSKRVGQVRVHFDAGQTRAEGKGTASSAIASSAATLPPAIRERLTRKRKAGDQDAAIDPLSAPEVRQAVASASFETLVGFQLTDEQLRYNASR